MVCARNFGTNVTNSSPCVVASTLAARTAARRLLRTTLVERHNGSSRELRSEQGNVASGITTGSRAFEDQTHIRYRIKSCGRMCSRLVGTVNAAFKFTSSTKPATHCIQAVFVDPAFTRANPALTWQIGWRANICTWSPVLQRHQATSAQSKASENDHIADGIAMLRRLKRVINS
jgi:hypothetical protein